jgi:hypothetical protein
MNIRVRETRRRYFSMVCAAGRRHRDRTPHREGTLPTLTSQCASFQVGASAERHMYAPQLRGCYAPSTHRARHSGDSKGSPKYPVALLILPSSNSTTSHTFI